jgi:Ca2+-transporting ATPase
MAQVAAATTGGLSSAEAADRLARYESERTATGPPYADLAAGRRPIARPADTGAAVGGALTVATGDLADTSVIVLVIVANAAVWVVQEVTAGQAIAALSDLTL